MSFQSLRTSLLFTLGIQPSETPPPAAAQDAADALNRGLQTLWLAGEDYFTREKLAVAVPANANSVTLDPTIQSVLGPIYDTGNNRSLRILSTRTDYDLYPQLYQPAGSAPTMPAGPLLACYVERLRGTSTGAAVVINLLFQPTAAAAAALQVQAVRTPPAYTAGQFAPGQTVPDPPVPDAYGETFLLPLARSFLIPSRYFSQRDQADAFRADAQRALVELGLADPTPAATLPTPGSAPAAPTTPRR